MLYNTGSTTFIKGQTLYLGWKLKFHFGQWIIIIKLKTDVLGRRRHFLDIFSSWTLKNFCCRVHLELFEKDGKAWLNIKIRICSNEQFQASIGFIFSCKYLVQLQEIFRIHLMDKHEWWYRDNKSVYTLEILLESTNLD